MTDPSEDAAILPADQHREEQLKQALWLSIGTLVDDACMALHANATPQFIAALTEAVAAQLEAVAGDIEAFAAHAGRTTVATADVMLLARRNEVLAGLMRGRLEGVKAAHEAGGAAGGAAGATRKGKERET